jgi:hypothetical protein
VHDIYKLHLEREEKMRSGKFLKMEAVDGVIEEACARVVFCCLRLRYRVYAYMHIDMYCFTYCCFDLSFASLVTFFRS